MRIGEVAAKAGVSVRALRYYEQQDLLHSSRNPGGQRRYADGAVERVRLIQQLYSVGLTSRTIREVLPFADAVPRHRNCSHCSRPNATASISR